MRDEAAANLYSFEKYTKRSAYIIDTLEFVKQVCIQYLMEQDWARSPDKFPGGPNY